MRMFLIALGVLISSAVVAQPLVVTPEIVTGPYAIGSSALTIAAAPPAALAADKHGVAIAWSAQGRIHIARLDAYGRIDGDIRVLPIRSTNTTAEAHHPSLAPAPSDEGFVIAWIETGRTVPLGAFAFLDADLTPSSPQFVRTNEVKSSIVVRSGSKVWIAADRDVWIVDRDNRGELWLQREWPALGMALVHDEPTVISRDLSSWLCTCSPGGPTWAPCPDGCKNYHWAFQLQLDQRFASIATRLFRFETHAEPALAADGDKLLIAWMDGLQASGGNVVLSTLSASQPASFSTAVETPLTIGKFRPDVGVTRPDIAANGKRRVVVWRNRSARGDYDVVGAAVDANGTVTRFDIATSNADERDPSVFALPNGNFLVAYEKRSGRQRSIAWRFVLFEGRRRAVR